MQSTFFVSNRQVLQSPKRTGNLISAQQNSLLQSSQIPVSQVQQDVFFKGTPKSTPPDSSERTEPVCNIVEVRPHDQLFKSTAELLIRGQHEEQVLPEPTEQDTGKMVQTMKTRMSTTPPSTRYFMIKNNAGVSIGAMGLQIHDEKANPIDGIYVIPEERDKGFGSRLLKQAEGEAEKAGADYMALVTSRKNVNKTIKWYTNRGYQIMETLMPKQIENLQTAGHTNIDDFVYLKKFLHKTR